MQPYEHLCSCSIISETSNSSSTIIQQLLSYLLSCFGALQTHSNFPPKSMYKSSLTTCVIRPTTNLSSAWPSETNFDCRNMVGNALSDGDSTSNSFKRSFKKRSRFKENFSFSEQSCLLFFANNVRSILESLKFTLVIRARVVEKQRGEASVSAYVVLVEENEQVQDVRFDISLISISNLHHTENLKQVEIQPITRYYYFYMTTNKPN
ncbi:hypothetical protein T09_14223 [Trichinella sp. T9]|nr:hypothetical protein T09_14223 [Trichinella sp. T9]